MGNAETVQKEKIREYKDKLKGIERLPTLPSIATQILKLANKKETSINEIIPLIEKDPPLAVKVLKIANSAYYGIRREIKSLRQAIVVIGLDELTNVTLSFSVLKNMNFLENDIEIHWKKFWKHCIYTGFVNDLLVTELNLRNVDTPYLNGLLHDIGKLVLDLIEGENYRNILSRAEEEGRKIYEIEKEELGITHAEIGRLTAEKWNLTHNVKDVIGSHHNDCKNNENEDIEAILSIQVANYVANYLGMDFVDVLDKSEINSQVCWQHLVEIVGYDEISFQTMVEEEFSERFESIKEMVELIQT